MFETLFNSYLRDLQKENIKSPIYKVFLFFKDKKYIKDNPKERIVIDFIAGMTDDYFNREYERITK